MIKPGSKVNIFIESSDRSQGNYKNATILERDEGHFGFIRFTDDKGKEHWLSIAVPFEVIEV